MLTEQDVWRLNKFVAADHRKHVVKKVKNRRSMAETYPNSVDHHGLPDTPHHFASDGKAVFTSIQLEWGLPEHFGWTEGYEVQDLGPDFALNWADEGQARRRAVHHYSRIDRFKFTLGQLLGCTGEVPPEVFDLMPAALKYVGKDELWVTVRQILKKAGLRIYYNRIPAILAGLGMIRFTGTGDKYQAIMADFVKMHNVFSAIKTKVKRVYFPNLRYVAVRLMAKHGVVLPYTIPATLTPAKTVALAKDFDEIWAFIIDRDCDEFTAEMEAFFSD
jgi:hypothetical protein